MRSRLGIAISAGKLGLIECGPAAEEYHRFMTNIPALFYRRTAVTGDDDYQQYGDAT